MKASLLMGPSALKLFGRGVAAIGAVAFAIGVMGAAQAANVTWSGSASSAWGTTTNWRPNSTGTAGPVGTNKLIFGTAVTSRTLVSFTGSNTYSGGIDIIAGSYTFAGSPLRVKNTITNSSGNQVKFNSGLSLNGDTTLTGANGYLVQTTSGTGGLQFGGTGTSTIVNAGGTGIVSQTAGTVYWNQGGYGGNVSAQGGTMQLGIDPAVSAAENYAGLTIQGNVTLTGAAVVMGIGGQGTGAGSAGNDYDAFIVTGGGGVGGTALGDITLGGDLSVDFASASGKALVDFTTFNLFQAAGTLSGNFNSITLTGSLAGGWAGVTGFTESSAGSGLWITTNNSVTGQWLEFTSATGNLVVVPEPSTMVFAGVGVAMAGFSAWKKRRNAKAKA